MDRATVDLDGLPDLVVLYLGMRVNALRGVPTLLSFGAKINQAVKAGPAGLLAHDPIIYSLYPLHIGMRQYWRDFESLETWARSDPHRAWWGSFVKDARGTGFWHEAYFIAGGMEAVYVNVPETFGFRTFAPVQPARGAMFSSRQRARAQGHAAIDAPVRESDLYG